MRNGFLYEKVILPYKKGKNFKVPLYHNKGTSVTIFHSNELKAKKKRFSSSKNKQYVEFKINQDLDLDNNYFLEYNDNAVIKRVEIVFIKGDFYLDNNNIKKGVNSFHLSKAKDFKNPTIILKSSKTKTKIEYNNVDSSTISFDLNIKKKDTYSLLIKDGVKSDSIDLGWVGKEYNHANVLDFKIDLSYNKNNQKVRAFLTNRFPLQEDKILRFTGSLDKEVIWKKGKKEKEIFFQKQILKHEKLNFNINNYVFSKTLINSNFFPTKIVKTSKGIRLEKMSNVMLYLFVDGEKFTIPARTLEYELNWEGTKNFKLYYDDYLLTESNFARVKYIPELTIKSDPLKAELTHSYYEDVEITFKNIDKKIYYSFWKN